LLGASATACSAVNPLSVSRQSASLPPATTASQTPSVSSARALTIA
jgi:hypothetical protein